MARELLPDIGWSGGTEHFTLQRGLSFQPKGIAMIKNYEVITATRIAELQSRVIERIKSGWQPTGGIAMLREDQLGDDVSHMVFAQAMVMANG